MDEDESCLGWSIRLFNRLMPIAVALAPPYPEGLGEQVLAIGEGMGAFLDRHGGWSSGEV